MKKHVIASLVLITILVSCKKDTVYLNADGSSTPKSGIAGNQNNPLLAGTKWVLAASMAVSDINGKPFEYDLFSLMPNCIRDNIQIYNSDGTCTADNGATKCDPSEPQTQGTAGTWTLSEDKKKFTIKFVPGANIKQFDAEVIQLDNSVFKIRYKSTSEGINSVTTTTYTRVK